MKKIFLNSEQEKTASHKKGPALVLAAAGSGKSTTLIERALRLTKETKHERILLITFSAKAAESLKEKVTSITGMFRTGFEISTFHALGLKIIKSAVGVSSLVPSEILIMKSWEQKKIICELIDDMKLNLDFKLVLSNISKMKKELVTPDNALQFLTEKEFQDAEQYTNLYRKYEEIKKSNKSIDFDDMILLPNILLDKNDIVKKTWQDMYDYIMIDECQDNNLAQFRIAELLSKKHSNIMMIGDDLQSIYGFQASRPDVTIKGFYEKYKATLYKMANNYRSSSEIVEKANKLTEHIGNPFNKDMLSTKGYLKNEVVWNVFSTKDEEALNVAEVSKKLVTNHNLKYKDIAVLYRTNRQSRAVEQALIEAQMPYVIYGGDSFFSRREVQDVMAFLKVADNPESSNIDIAQIINISSVHYPTTTRRLGRAFVNDLRNHNQVLWKALETFKMKPYQKKAVQDFKFIIRGIQVRNTIKEKVEYIINNSYDRYIRNELGVSDDDGDFRSEILEEIVEVFSQFTDFPGLQAYVLKMQDSNKKEKDPNFNGVQLMTIHKSKGLEWDTVFLIGMNNTILPHLNSGTLENGIWSPIDVSEERRICYVGITRAKHSLILSSRNDAKGPFSLFLREMDITTPTPTET